MNQRTNSKHAKYATSNPISRKLVDGFYSKLVALYKLTGVIDNYLEVGCGEGFVTRTLIDFNKPQKAFAVDLDPKEVEDAKKLLPECKVSIESIYSLDARDASYDLVVCCEVLEHLDKPEEALKEIHRVSSNFVLLSVPREPLWRFLNMVRLKYLADFGNTPDHRNHWSRKSFLVFVEKRFEIVKVLSPIPWTIVLAKKKR